MAGGRGFCRQAQKVVRDGCCIQSVQSDQLVEGGQGGGQLRAFQRLARNDRDEGGRAATVRGPLNAGRVQMHEGLVVHLPACGAVHQGRAPKDFAKTLLGPGHL